MLILTQDRRTLVNLDNVVMLCKFDSNEDGEIAYANNHSESLGFYKDTPEHENQLERIAQCIGAASVYKMPEE